jgi:hypothetical protein
MFLIQWLPVLVGAYTFAGISPCISDGSTTSLHTQNVRTLVLEFHVMFL